MGMYDEVRCKVDLPDEYVHDKEKFIFQTKDLENIMGRFTITEEGRLIEHKFHLEPVPEEEKVHEHHILKRIEDGDVDLDYHGYLTFYTRYDVKDEFLEFQAKFTDGKVVEIIKTSNYHLSIDGSDGL